MAKLPSPEAPPSRDWLDEIEDADVRALARQAADEGDSPFEVALYRELGVALRAGQLDPPLAESWTPSEALLLQVRRAPASVEPAVRAQLDAWLEAHPAERDAYEAFRSLAAMAATAEQPAGALARVGAWLSGILSPLTGPALAPAALTLLLAVGLLFSRDLFGRDVLVRGEEGPGAPARVEQPAGPFELTLAPDDAVVVARSTLPREGQIRLRLVLPAPHAGGPVSVALERGDGARRSEPILVEAGSELAVVDLDVAWLAGAEQLALTLGPTRFALRLE